MQVLSVADVCTGGARADDALPAAPTRCLPVQGLRDGRPYAGHDWVAEEVPVALEFNGISQAVMLATPLDLEDFARGFALTEGILERPNELREVEEVVSELGITLRLTVSNAAFARLKARRRSLIGRTGCGLCGTESLAHVARELPRRPDPSTFTPLHSAAIADGLAAMADRQTLQQATGAMHAAGWCTPEGELRCLREDVGRHNALDKLVGAMSRTDLDAASGFIVVTSRASFEMVQKSVVAGVAVLAAVSAPTALAVRTAEGAGLCLVGFARRRNLAVYSHPHRVRLDGPGDVAEPADRAHRADMPPGSERLNRA